MTTEPEGKVYLNSSQYNPKDGLTKREYFAALALQGLLANNPDTYVGEVEITAVECADDLIKELNKIL